LFQCFCLWYQEVTLAAGVLWLLLYIFGLLLISSFAGFLPVVSWVLVHNLLIINTIQFSGLYAIAGW
jgi:hypothetical protein